MSDGTPPPPDWEAYKRDYNWWQRVPHWAGWWPDAPKRRPE